MKQRLKEIPTLEVILCFYVVMIHVLSDSITGYRHGTFLSAASFFCSRTLTFSVPAFIMASGIKFSYNYDKNTFNYIKFLKGRIKKIYIPFVITTILYYLYFVFLRKYFPFSISDLLKYIALGTISAPFYFIIIIMQFYILAPMSYLMCRQTKPFIGLLLSFVVMLLFMYLSVNFRYSDRIFLRYLLYWILGCYIGINFEKALELLQRHKVMIIILGIFFIGSFTTLSYLEFRNIFHSFITEIIKVFFSFFSSVMHLALIPKKITRPVKLIAPATFYIYLVHCLILTTMQWIFEIFSLTSVSVRLIILVFTVFPISFMVSLLYSKLKKIIFQ